MKIYCVFYLSFLSFIFLVYKIPSAGEIKSNKLDKIFENNSKIPSNTIDNFDSKGFFKKNKVEKKEDKFEIDFSSAASNKFFYDVIYQPFKTEFSDAGHLPNNFYVNGLNMFLYQGQKAFNIWHKIEPAITENLLKYLKNKD